jgi:ATP phosphoribosyltransferase
MGFAGPNSYPDTAELLERFKATKLKVAVHKDGSVLTDISKTILADTYGIIVPPRAEKDKKLLGISEDGEVGFVFARNKSICHLISSGAVDLAVIGTDRLIEDGAEDRVDIIASFRDRYSWPLVVATPFNSDVRTVNDINRVATQYPTIAQRYFETLGRNDIEVVETAGGTELYPYLAYGSGPIDAIVDLTSTGQTLALHNLVPWLPSIGDVYPVLIQAKQL